MEEDRIPPRQEYSASITTIEEGRQRLKLIDRINIDDVFLHLVRREIFRLRTGEDNGVDIPVTFKDFLVRERYTTGQN